VSGKLSLDKSGEQLTIDQKHYSKSRNFVKTDFLSMIGALINKHSSKRKPSCNKQNGRAKYP
jgi:hypothetical protein